MTFQESLPGMDNREAANAGLNEVVDIGAFFERFTTKSTTLQDSWPRFRGPDYDNIKKQGVPLISQFEADNPKIMWSVELGEGHAGASIYKGKVYVLDYDEEVQADMLRCFALTDGQEIWRRWYKVHIKRNHGMSRTVPAVTDEYIVTIGPRSHVMCVDREDGEFRWGRNIEQEYQTEIPFWYTGQCPLIDEGKAIVATGGKALMVALDCESGELLWETPNPGEWKMSHASIMPWEYEGVKMYVYSAVGGVCGIMAEGPDAGKILWESSAWNHSVVAPSAVCMPDGRVFLTAGYGAGSMVLQVTKKDGQFSVEKGYEYKPNEGLACEQQTPIYYEGMLYGILPKDAGTMRNQFVCVSPEDTRQIVWSSGKTHRFGLGPYMIADGKFFILNDNGTLSIVRPSKESFVLLDEVQVFEAHDAWAPLAVADGYMVLRDAEKMVCLDVSKS